MLTCRPKAGSEALLQVAGSGPQRDHSLGLKEGEMGMRVDLFFRSGVSVLCASTTRSSAQGLKVSILPSLERASHTSKSRGIF